MKENLRILVVEDDPSSQIVILDTLEGVGELKVVSSGEEGLEVLDVFLPDLIVLDIMMPGMDGYQVCEKIRTNPRLKDSKVIVTSGKDSTVDVLKGLDLGADDYLTKPFDPHDLLRKVQIFSQILFSKKSKVAK